jgi:hypothetical protein
MPTFELEFEVFCATCGAGLCNVSDTRSSYRRHMPQVTVEACENCIDNAKEPLEEEIRELKEEIEELKKELVY